MSIVLDLPPEVEERLRRNAASQGVPVEVLAANAIASLSEPEVKPPDQLDFEEWKKRFDEHMKIVDSRADRYPPGHVTDSSRESIYEGCGE